MSYFPVVVWQAPAVQTSGEPQGAHAPPGGPQNVTVSPGKHWPYWQHPEQVAAEQPPAGVVPAATHLPPAQTGVTSLHVPEQTGASSTRSRVVHANDNAIAMAKTFIRGETSSPWQLVQPWTARSIDFSTLPGRHSLTYSPSLRDPAQHSETARLDPPLRDDYEEMVRAFISLVAALALGWSSIVDNPAVCADDLPGQTASNRPCNDEGTPAVPCVSCPCHLPSLRVSVDTALQPRVRIEDSRSDWPEQHLQVAEPVPPPTPPPLA